MARRCCQDALQSSCIFISRSFSSSQSTCIQTVHSNTYTIRYNRWFALENWQASCQFNLAQHLTFNFYLWPFQQWKTARWRKKLQVVYNSLWESIAELRSVTCHVGSHSVTCHSKQLNAPHLNSNPTKHAGTRYPEGLGDWVDLGVGYIPKWFTCPQTVAHPSSNHLIATSPEVESNHYAMKPPTSAPGNVHNSFLFCGFWFSS